MDGSNHELLSGEALYRRALDRDQDALAALVDLYGGPLTAYIRGIVGNPHDAEELMVDAFVQLIRSKAVFTSNEALKAYLFKIGKHNALRHLEKYGKGRMTAEYLDILLENRGGSARPEAEMLRAEQRRQLDEAMEKLKPEHRQVLQLLFYENMSYADAGSVMHKTVRQIDGLAYRAKASLRKKLEKGGYTFEAE